MLQKVQGHDCGCSDGEKSWLLTCQRLQLALNACFWLVQVLAQCLTIVHTLHVQLPVQNCFYNPFGPRHCSLSRLVAVYCIGVVVSSHVVFIIVDQRVDFARVVLCARIVE